MTDDVSDHDGDDDTLDSEPWPEDYDFGALDRSVMAMADQLEAVGDRPSAVLARDAMTRMREVPGKYRPEESTAELFLALEDLWKGSQLLCDLIAKHFAPPA